MTVQVKHDVRDYRAKDTSKMGYDAHRETMKERGKKVRVFFFHDGENVMDDLFNRFARPRDAYKSFLPDVAEKLDLPRETKFRWSQRAGCSCGCSPGFVVDGVYGREAFVTLSNEAPRTCVTSVEEDRAYRDQVEALVA